MLDLWLHHKTKILGGNGFGKLECQLHLYKKKLKAVQSNVLKKITLDLKFINISPTKIKAFTKPCMKTYMINKTKQKEVKNIVEFQWVEIVMFIPFYN